MPNGPRILLDNACYHIITRANQKQRIFRNECDFKEYLERLYKYKTRHGFKLYGFCLMPNHVHMLGEVEEKENLSGFMHDLSRSYTAYFNKKYQNVGYLWQGRFKSKIIIKDRYFVNCINYIELNPVRADIVKTPMEYRWSSYMERNFGMDKKYSILNQIEL